MTYSQEPSLFFILDEIVESWSSQMKNFGATAAMYNEEPFLDLTNNQELKCRTIELGLQDSGLSGACLYISFFHNASNEWEVGTIELLPTPDQDRIKKTAVLKMLEYFSEKFKEALPGGWVYSFAGQTVKFLKAWVSWRNKH